MAILTLADILATAHHLHNGILVDNDLLRNVHELLRPKLSSLRIFTIGRKLDGEIYDV